MAAAPGEARTRMQQTHAEGAHKTNGGARRTGRILLRAYPFRCLFASPFTSFLCLALRVIFLAMRTNRRLQRLSAVKISYYNTPPFGSSTTGPSSLPFCSSATARPPLPFCSSATARLPHLFAHAPQQLAQSERRTIRSGDYSKRIQHGLFAADDYSIYGRRLHYLQQTITADDFKCPPSRQFCSA